MIQENLVCASFLSAVFLTLRSLWLKITLRPSWAGLTLVLIFGLGVLFRVYGLGDRDLWADEAWVALAALQDTPAAALAAGESTPPLYLLTVWALARALGGSEAVLRSLSLVFGLGTLFLFWPLARRLTPLPASLLGLSMVAFSPITVYFAKELKQYSGDAFFAVLIFFLVERLRLRESGWMWTALVLAGILGLGFSHALVFTLPAALAGLWFGLPARRFRAVLLGFAWAAAFAAYFLLFFRGQVDPKLLAYWAQDFPDFSGLGAFLWWLAAACHRYFTYFFDYPGVYWGLPLAAAGIPALLWRGGCRVLFYWLGPLLVTLAAAALHRYPFMGHYNGNRLMLFSAPLLYLVAAVGLVSVLGWLWKKLQRVPALVLTGLLLLLINPVGLIKENIDHAHNREEIEPLVDHLKDRLQPQDWIYVYHFAVAPFKYYFQSPEERICWGKSCVERKLEVPADRGKQPQRLWLIASHFPSMEEMRKFTRELLGPQWREAACLSRTSAALFCFERQGTQLAKKTAPSAKPPGFGPPTPPGDKAYR